MKWSVLNGIGALAWLAGLSMAKGSVLPASIDYSMGDHRVLVGLSFGLIGLAVLLWANLRSTA